MELTTTHKILIAGMVGYALGMAVAMWANRPRPISETGTVTKVPCAPCAEKREAEAEAAALAAAAEQVRRELAGGEDSAA